MVSSGRLYSVPKSYFKNLYFYGIPRRVFCFRNLLRMSKGADMIFKD